jgi:hypothetical protein
MSMCRSPRAGHLKFQRRQAETRSGLDAAVDLRRCARDRRCNPIPSANTISRNDGLAVEAASDEEVKAAFALFRRA